MSTEPFSPAPAERPFVLSNNHTGGAIDIIGECIDVVSMLAALAGQPRAVDDAVMRGMAVTLTGLEGTLRTVESMIGRAEP